MNGVLLPPTTRKHRGLTPELWRMAQVEAADQDPAFGIHFRDDFFGVAQWTKTNLNSATSTFTNIALRGGAARLDPGSTTANHGCQVQHGAGFLKIAEGYDFFGEFLIRMNNITTAPNALVGWGEIDSSLLSAAGALAVDDFIGFKYNAADGKFDFVAIVGGSATTVADIYTPTNADWFMLGVRVLEGRLAIPYIDSVQYDGDAYVINGTAKMPTELLTPSLAICGAGTTQPTLDVDWARAFDSFTGEVR